MRVVAFFLPVALILLMIAMFLHSSREPAPEFRFVDDSNGGFHITASTDFGDIGFASASTSARQFTFTDIQKAFEVCAERTASTGSSSVVLRDISDDYQNKFRLTCEEI
jgi:hypothetical protein